MNQPVSSALCSQPHFIPGHGACPAELVCFQLCVFLHISWAQAASCNICWSECWQGPSLGISSRCVIVLLTKLRE